VDSTSRKFTFTIARSKLMIQLQNWMKIKLERVQCESVSATQDT
jgi:hypothetical protein